MSKMISLTSQKAIDTILISGDGLSMAGGYYQPRGRKTYRVWVSWRGKKIFVNKYLDGSKLFHIEQAKRVLEKIRAEIDQGIFDPALWGKDKALRIDRAWQVYQDQAPCGRDRAEARDRIFRDFILPYFKDKTLKEIEEHHVRDWWAGIDKGYAPSYLRVIRATLRAFLNFHKITRMKAITFPVVKVPRKSIEWLKMQEQEKILQSVPIQHRAILRFIQLYGCRVSEACNLKKSDLDWEKEIITFRERKNQKDNTLAILDEAKSFLKPQKVTHWEYVFCTVTGQKYSRQMLYHIWIEASKKAGVKIIPLKNATRHSLACQLLEAGESPVAVSRILGNSPQVVMRFYGNISIRKAKEILKNRS